jgi:hypothetical protein
LEAHYAAGMLLSNLLGFVAYVHFGGDVLFRFCGAVLALYAAGLVAVVYHPRPGRAHASDGG